MNPLEEASEQRHQAYLEKKRDTYHTMKRDFPARWRAMAAKNGAANKRRYRHLKENNPEEHAALRRKYAETSETEEQTGDPECRPSRFRIFEAGYNAQNLPKSLVVKTILPGVDRHHTLTDTLNINGSQINLIGKSADNLLNPYDIKTNHSDVVAEIRSRIVADKRRIGADTVRRSLYGGRSLHPTRMRCRLQNNGLNWNVVVRRISKAGTNYYNLRYNLALRFVEGGYSLQRL
ncbi:uncharacterized protein B0T23DRAFT_428161 [Neurospora hispaniola]|uniref:Uncharacterized protein n=1 Tax=Neurospora hispaniola TaxID=588809 RepID=A0AAJ0MSX4_9PEZI|nr:hypothetical protein B0T23DRAFT_428161 [Neurospora hispaniola]